MPGKQIIHLHCMCWNDARMLPFFFRHYDKIVDKYFVHDNGSTDGSIALLEKHKRVELSHFDVSGDSFVDEARQLCDSAWRNSEADWVIIADLDEHIYHPRLTNYLQRCTKRGVTAIKAIGYEMISDSFPSGNRPLCELVTIGTRSLGHDKLCIFSPRYITATNYAPGRHEAAPTGRVVWPAYSEVLLLHYKQLGVDYPIARSAELRSGLRSRDLTEKWGVQYTWNPVEIAAKWQEIRAAAGPVPGLGALKHLSPAKYNQERIVKESGLFDPKWYLAAYPDVEAAGIDPLSHYCAHGWEEGRQPNFYFDPEWYCVNYPDLHTPGCNPLCDYVVRGEQQGAWPSQLFNTDWYRTEHGLSADESPLRHYLEHRTSGLVSPLPDFVVADYCQSHPEILASAGDPFEAYCRRHAESEPEQAH
ncbi:MAG: glycosyltransferase family 2 protein [Deltaproteobacteria bacterium]|nr:glycosyltransferase family 2 protein [Deltaproteobacteria bacterium]